MLAAGSISLLQHSLSNHLRVGKEGINILCRQKNPQEKPGLRRVAE